MKNTKKRLFIVFIISSMIVCGCGKSNNDLNNTETVTSEQASSSIQEELSTETEEISGFYNCVKSKEPFLRVDFEIKESNDEYKAIFYVQHTEESTYDYGEILHGKMISNDTYKFSGTEEEYTVIWDKQDTLSVEGTYYNGEFERGVKDSYGELDYIIEEVPKYEADNNVEEGIEIDKTLGKLIRMELAIEPDHKLTYSDLDNVTTIWSYDEVVTSIKGVSLLKNLDEIHISCGCVDDISELALCENIRFIDISSCYVKEIPDFSNCSKLESLYLSGNMIKDPSPIKDVPSLRYVDLNVNHIESIESLKGISNIEMLCIEANCILDYYKLKGDREFIKMYNEGSQGTFEEALALEERAKQIVDDFGDDLTELELEVLIYKYIKDTMEFDDSDRPMKAYGYSGIMNGRGVCGDYAEAFDLLASHAGLMAYSCYSEDHAWNMVRIDGSYYHCDALWDEDVDVWTHFNKSTGFMMNLENHTHDINRYHIADISMSVLEYCDYFE